MVSSFYFLFRISKIFNKPISKFILKIVSYFSSQTNIWAESNFLFAAWLASLYIKNSVRPDIGLARKIGNYFQNKFADRFVKNFGDSEKEIEATYHRNKKLAPILAIVYALLTSFIAFDWMMSIDQEWFSTMFGVQFTVSSLIGAGALMLVITGIFRFKFQLTEYLSINRHHDLAKQPLLFVYFGAI